MLKLREVRKNNDGTATYSWECDHEFKEYYKNETNAQVLDDKEIGKFIVNMVQSVFGDSTPNSSQV